MGLQCLGPERFRFGMTSRQVLLSRSIGGSACMISDRWITHTGLPLGSGLENSSRFRIFHGLFRVWSFGSRVSSFGYRISGIGFRESGFACLVQLRNILGSDLRDVPLLLQGFRISDFGFRASGLKFQNSSFGFQILGFEFRVQGFEFMA